jgi:hypothetical protein
MARMEKGPPAQQEIAQLKQDVVREVRKMRRRRVPIIRLLAVALFVSGIAWTVWVLAASGLVSIPYVSAYAYTRPEPARVVIPGEPVETVVSDRVHALLTERLQEGGGQIADPQFELDLPEGSFTRTLQAALAGEVNEFIDEDRAQVAVLTGEGLEIFLPFTKSAESSALVVTVNIHVSDGALTFDPPRVRLGSLRLPAWFSEMVVTPPLRQGLSAFEAEAGKLMKILDVRMENGSLRVRGEFQVEVFPLENP